MLATRGSKYWLLVLTAVAALPSCAGRDEPAAPSLSTSAVRLTQGTVTPIEDDLVVEQRSNRVFAIHSANKTVLWGVLGQPLDSLTLSDDAFPVVAAAAEQTIDAVRLANATSEVYVDPNPTPPNLCPPPLDYCPDPPSQGLLSARAPSNQTKALSVGMNSPQILVRVRGRVMQLTTTSAASQRFAVSLFGDPCVTAKMIIAENRERVVASVPGANAYLDALKNMIGPGTNGAIPLELDFAGVASGIAQAWAAQMYSGVVLGAAVVDYNTFCTTDRSIITSPSRVRLNQYVMRGLNGPGARPTRYCTTEVIEVSTDGGLTWRPMLAEVCETIRPGD